MTDEKKPSYEEARDQLIKVVQQLESGNVDLSESMRLWERGEKLAALCQEWLTGAAETIEKARRGACGVREWTPRACGVREWTPRAHPGGPDADAQA